MSCLSDTLRSAGPVAFESSLWQAAQLALNNAFPLTGSPAAAAGAGAAVPAEGDGAVAVTLAAGVLGASWAEEVKEKFSIKAKLKIKITEIELSFPTFFIL